MNVVKRLVLTVKLREMEIEQSYFDKNGKEIKEFAVLKVFHFIGRRRKKHFMYKWVRLEEWDGKLYWVGRHLTEEIKPKSGYFLKATANAERKIMGSEIVQQYE